MAIPGLSPYYFCPVSPGAQPSAASGADTAPGCVNVSDENDAELYFYTKSAHLQLMSTLAEKHAHFLDPDAIYETAVIAWLIGREIGHRPLSEDTVQKKVFKQGFAKYANTARVKFWRAKVALILINDIDNPYSQEYLNLKHDSGEPVFSINLPPGKTEFSNAEKMQLLKEVYQKLIKPLGDDLLEAECLMAQFELRATDPNLKPSQDISYLKAKIEAVLSETAIKVPDYIYKRIPPQGYNIDTLKAYWGGGKMRQRETFRYMATAQKLKAQLILFETKYNDPNFETKVNQALKSLQASQSLVAKYAESPAKVVGSLNWLYKKHGIQKSMSVKKFKDAHGDLMNLLSIEQMKAAAYYKLGLHAQFSDTAQTQSYFQKAENITQTIISVIESIKKEHPKWKAVDPTKWIEKIYFWRSTTLGAAKLLLADIFLAQDKNIKKATDLIKEVVIDKDDEHLVRGEGVVRSKLALISSILRKKAASFTDQVQKVRGAEKVLASLIDPNNPSPAVKSLLGSIRLAQAKVLLAKFYLDESDFKIPEAVVNILDEQIAKARPGNNFNPTPLDFAPEKRPNNGVFEDYELATAPADQG
ncbi:MAG: hypothetical protein ABIA67_01335 [Candidatus Margulisiibacteriota bacterium]